MTMGNVAIVGTGSSHGGTMITGSGTHFTTVDGAVCRVGDLHSCPITGHGITPIVSGGAVNTNCQGLALAIQGSVAGCGAVLDSNFAPNCQVT